jgi:hypothetical protein
MMTPQMLRAQPFFFQVRNAKFVVVFLTVMPAVVEAVVTAGIAVGFFEFRFFALHAKPRNLSDRFSSSSSYLWGVMLGFGLSDMAKAISVPVLCDCAQKKLRYRNPFCRCFDVDPSSMFCCCFVCS